MSKLKAVKPQESKPRKPKVVIYGSGGVGKTWWALNFPGVYYIDVEGGAKEGEYIDRLTKSGGGYFGPEHGSTVIEEVNDQLVALMTEKHDYHTVVIDSATELFNERIADESDRLERENKKNEFGLDKKLALKPFRKLVRLVKKIDLNVVLICHEKDEWGKVDGNREAIGKTFDCWDKVDYMLDLTIHVTQSGKSRYGRPTKSRISGFPRGERFNWTFEEFAKRWGGEAITRASELVVLASKESLAEINRIFEVLNYPDDKKAKLLKHFQVEEFEEITEKQAQGLITKLKTI